MKRNLLKEAHRYIKMIEKWQMEFSERPFYRSKKNACSKAYKKSYLSCYCNYNVIYFFDIVVKFIVYNIWLLIILSHSLSFFGAKYYYNGCTDFNTYHTSLWNDYNEEQSELLFHHWETTQNGNILYWETNTNTDIFYTMEEEEVNTSHIQTFFEYTKPNIYNADDKQSIDFNEFSLGKKIITDIENINIHNLFKATRKSEYTLDDSVILQYYPLPQDHANQTEYLNNILSKNTDNILLENKLQHLVQLCKNDYKNKIMILQHYFYKIIICWLKEKVINTIKYDKKYPQTQDQYKCIIIDMAPENYSIVDDIINNYKQKYTKIIDAIYTHIKINILDARQYNRLGLYQSIIKK